ncbi:hypothetical protein IJU97_03045 [bacterium]|nr:hypothetical protein [bacterium]
MSFLERKRFDFIKNRLESHISELPKKQWETEIKPVFMEISKNFKSYSKFLSFSKYMVKQLI